MGISIAVIEDVETLRAVLCSVLESNGFSVRAFADAESALKPCLEGSFDCILSDYKLPQKNGLSLLQELRDSGISTPFILMTAYSSVELAVNTLKNGGNDFLAKPFEPERLISAIEEVVKHRRIVTRESGTRSNWERTLLTEDPAFQRVIDTALKVSKVDSSVLILGESGTGKELLARSIHENSKRSRKPFIAINCAAIPKELLESEFFGHEEGAFTGATQTRLGVFELASEGTIFLDEIGDMPKNLQVKLLRALQEKEIKRVGGIRTIKVNPRIIAATNCDEHELLFNGKIREDLFYRLAVVTLKLLPLRHRPKDIPLIASFYLDRFSKEFKKKDLTFSKEAITALSSYHWPGNVRELENAIERAVLLGSEVITSEQLGVTLGLDLGILAEARESLTEIGVAASNRAEAEALERALTLSNGNKSQAARMLKVSYKTLLNKAKEYNLQ